MKKLLLVFCLFLISCTVSKEDKEEVKLPYFNSYELTPEWNVKSHKIEDFTLTNQEGLEVSEQDYKGKIYVTNFFFTSCSGICHQLIKNMTLLQEEFKTDVNIKFLSHSVTPEIDSISTLKKYADYHQINSKQWSLVTGSKNEIYKLARDSYFADEDYMLTQKPSTFIHNENFLLIDPDGYIRGVYNGTLKLEMSRIAKHIQLLKKEFRLP
ncbi:SCO family protein [Wenyingzhuangia sp. IMCC45574]